VLERGLGGDGPEGARLVGGDGPEGARLVGVAGTITTLAALASGLEAYERARIHRSLLSRADVEDWSDRLSGMTVAEVRALGPVEAGRADVLVAGALICLEVMRHLGAGELLVSERDLLDGCVLGFA
jgi:exopolyphosphatase / guanosine-5'-triphosphate,3'-diphosphate pyrophosphatase